jgi:hypothetical protein
VRILFVALNPLDYLMLNVIECLGLYRRAFLRAALGSYFGKLQFIGNAIDIKVKEDVCSRTIIVPRLAQQIEKP